MFKLANEFFSVHQTLEKSAKKIPNIHYYPDRGATVSSENILLCFLTQLSEQIGPVLIDVLAYTEVPHGGKARTVRGQISSVQLRTELDAFIHESEKEIGACVPTVSGVFYDASGKKWVMPMLDLEITATGTDAESLHQDLNRVMRIFAENGLTGTFLRSGDVSKGSYHFIADFVLPYEPYFWQTLGLFLNILVDVESVDSGEVIPLSKSFGERILNSESIHEAQEIAREILKPANFPSITSGVRRNGLFSDPRWVAHTILDSSNYLARVTPVKGYAEQPVEVAEVF